MLFAVLDDPGLHGFTGGRPRTREELDDWIRFVAGGRSPSGEETWWNWVIRVADGSAVVGTAQATSHGHEATLAWVIGTPFQGRGYAKEAAAAVASWLTATAGILRLRATIHPEHEASAAVARSIGLEPTGERDDGEIVWRNPPSEP